MAPEAKPGPRAPQMPEAHHTSSISARRVIYWAWQTVSVARVRFVANLGTSILVQQLSLYKSQLLVTVIALLASGGVRPTAGQGQDAAVHSVDGQCCLP